MPEAGTDGCLAALDMVYWSMSQKMNNDSLHDVHLDVQPCETNTQTYFVMSPTIC